MSQPTMVIDGMSMLRSISGPAVTLSNGYTYSFLVQATATLKKIKPKGIFICWEGGFTRRLEILPTYKANRKPTPEGIKFYREQVKALMRSLGADQLFAPGYEADDVGAYLANTLENVVLVSADKDWLQLVRPGVSIFQKTRREGRKAEKVLITHENFPEMTGWSSPTEYLKAHCAKGDSVDGIPGIPGIGDGFILAYLQGMSIPPNKAKALDEFFDNSEHYLRNKELIDLTQIKELPVEYDPGVYDENKALELLNEYGFAGITKKFDSWVDTYRQARV